MRTWSGAPNGDVRVNRMACLLMLPLLACTGNPSTVQGMQSETEWSGSTTVQLVSGKATVVGAVTVAMDHDKLLVTYTLDPPWSMTESHLDIETDVGLIPQTPKQHNPIPGHFAFHAEHSPAVAEYTYRKDISWQPGDTLYIAAHAEVQRSGDCSGQCPPSGDDDGGGAWAAGTRFTPRGNPATYFTFRPTVQAVLDHGDKWMLTRVAGQTTDGTNALFDASLYMLQDAAGITESPLPADIQADLLDGSDAEQFVVVSQSVVSEIVASEQAGSLTPALEAIAEPLDTLAPSGRQIRGLFGKCSDKPFTKSKTINLDNLILPGSSEALPENVSLDLTFAGRFSGAVTLEMHLAKRRFKFLGSCIPYAVGFKDLHVFGIATVDYAAILEGSVTFSEEFAKELLKLELLDVWFFVGPVPVRAVFELPISIGVDLSASVTASVAYHSGQTATGSLDYTCTIGGCTGGASFQLSGSSVPATLTGAISGRLQPSVWAEAAFRGVLYTDRLASVQVAVRPFLHGDLWGFFGNDCGDADGDGANEIVRGLTFDLDSEITANLAASLFNRKSHSINLFSTGKHHLKFFDLIGSTALSPVVEGRSTATTGQPAGYLVSMRSCWPYTDRVSHRVAWGDGTFDTVTDVPPAGVGASHTWLQAGTYSLEATSLSDEHGRSLNQSTSRNVEVTGVINGAIPTAGMHLWLRADAGISPPGGSKISGWADQSGNGRNGTMLTVSRQPDLVPGALNGQPVVRFNGAQSMSLDVFAEPIAFSVFIVGKNSKAGQESIILGPGGSSPNNQLRWEDNTNALFVGTGNNLPVSISPIGNTHVYHALSARYDGANMTVFRDGGVISTHSFTTSGPWTFASIGSFYSNVFLEGDLAEILIYDRALSEPERLTVNNYLRTKYGLP